MPYANLSYLNEFVFLNNKKCLILKNSIMFRSPPSEMEFQALGLEFKWN